MLHAVIRAGKEAFHFFGDVDAYSLQTVRQHVRQGSKEFGNVHLSLEIDPADQKEFQRRSRRWLPRLSDAGTVVEVKILGAG